MPQRSRRDPRGCTDWSATPPSSAGSGATSRPTGTPPPRRARWSGRCPRRRAGRSTGASTGRTGPRCERRRPAWPLGSRRGPPRSGLGGVQRLAAAAPGPDRGGARRVRDLRGRHGRGGGDLYAVPRPTVAADADHLHHRRRDAARALARRRDAWLPAGRLAPRLDAGDGLGDEPAERRRARDRAAARAPARRAGWGGAATVASLVVGRAAGSTEPRAARAGRRCAPCRPAERAAAESALAVLLGRPAFARVVPCAEPGALCVAADTGAPGLLARHARDAPAGATTRSRSSSGTRSRSARSAPAGAPARLGQPAQPAAGDDGVPGR